MRAIIEQNWLLYVMAAAGMLGILSQMILNRCYRLLIREASDTQVEKKEFMKKLKMRFGTNRKRSGGNMNMNIFLQRSLMDYRYHRFSLHQWKRIGVGMFLISLCVGAAGIIYSMQTGISQVHIRPIYELAAVITVATAAMSLWLDTGYKKSYLLTILEDYFCHSGASVEYTPVNFDDAAMEESAGTKEMYVEAPGVAAVTEKIRKKAPSIVGIRRKNAMPAETKAQREKRELQENLSRFHAGVRETAAAEPETVRELTREQKREQSKELLRQMDVKEQERIIRDVLAEFLA